MPRTRVRRRPRMKRKPAIRRRLAKRHVARPNNGLANGGIPPFINVKFRYNDYLSLDTINGGCSGIQYIMNSLSKPEGTVTPVGRNTTPYLFAFYTNTTTGPYNAYTVNAFKIIVQSDTCNPNGVETFRHLLVDSGPFQIPHDGSSYPNYATTNLVQYERFPKKRMWQTTTAKPGRAKYFTTIAKSFGIHPNKVRDSNSFSATYNTSPEDEAWCSILTESGDNTLTTAYNLRIQITYYARLWEPRYNTTNV